MFHPTEDLVLPGILSHAYTFDGHLKPLFLSSKCRFSVCSISADKMKLLTDCANDAKSIIMWSLTDGSEMNRFTWSGEILSFALCRNGKLLAISDLSGSIALLDVMDDYRPLVQTTLSEDCGMINFSPDCRCLYCLSFNDNRCDLFRLVLNMENQGNVSLDVLPDEVSYQPWEFESRRETGFLTGDPFCLPSEIDTIYSWGPGLAFVLNEQSVLRVGSKSNIVEMLQLDKLTNGSAGVLKTTVTNVTLSLNGGTLFIITRTDDSPAKLMGWDISSGLFKPGTERVLEDTDGLNVDNCVAVREGVLLQTSRETLELWNFELSECIRSWTDLGAIFKVIPISEERVACEDVEKVIVVDTTREGIVSTIPFCGLFVACNSKCHVITAHYYNEMHMQCGDKVLWEIQMPFNILYLWLTFSPSEQYCVVRNLGLYVLDVVSGKPLHKLYLNKFDSLFICEHDCKFVSDEECVVYFGDASRGYFLQLFNVKSGDLLSEIALESRVYSLTACPRERLIAIGLRDSKVNFKVLRVKKQGDKDNRKSKRSGFIYVEQSYSTINTTQPPDRF